jgi:hypothetical protein
VHHPPLAACCEIENGGWTGAATMKSQSKFAVTALLLLASVAGAVVTRNMVAGIGPVASNFNWFNFSAVNLISGDSLYPISSSTTVLYIGFTGGSTQADIGNMVIYQTDQGRPTIKSVHKVTLNGISNPSIVLTDPNVCPIQPVSEAKPCIVRLDPLTLSLSAKSDYYFTLFFIGDANNQALAVATPKFAHTTSLTGWVDTGDDTQLKAGQSIPSANNVGEPFVITAVKNN